MLRYLATTDELTGLWNRRYFSQALIKAIEGARRHDRTFSLLMLDIDHFKRINDSLGHAAGDEVLRHFGLIITEQLPIFFVFSDPDQRTGISMLISNRFKLHYRKIFLVDFFRNIKNFHANYLVVGVKIKYYTGLHLF